MSQQAVDCCLLYSCVVFQIINLLSQSELNLVVPRQVLYPRTFRMRPGEGMYVSGLARIDYTQVLVAPSPFSAVSATRVI